MKFAVVSDIHSNIPALDAVLKDIEEQKVDKIICLGDVIGYGPHPIECSEKIMKRCDVVICGNHDEALKMGGLGFNGRARRAIEWTQEQLRPGFFSGMTIPLLREAFCWHIHLGRMAMSFHSTFFHDTHIHIAIDSQEFLSFDVPSIFCFHCLPPSLPHFSGRGRIGQYSRKGFGDFPRTRCVDKDTAASPGHYRSDFNRKLGPDDRKPRCHVVIQLHRKRKYMIDNAWLV